MALAQDTYADSSASDYQSLIAHVATNLGSGNPFGVEASAFAVALSTEAHSIADATQTDSNGDALVAEAQALAGTTATQQFDDEQAEQSADTDQQSAQQAFDQAMTQVGVNQSNAAQGYYQPLLLQLPTATNSSAVATDFSMVDAEGLNGNYLFPDDAYNGDPYFGQVRRHLD